MKAIDLCCGAGGLTRGLRRAGWDVVLGIDVDATVEETYRSINSESKFLAADLRSLPADDIRDVAGGIAGPELLLAGCAPCQTFSKQRHRRGLKKRSDATLLREFGRLVIDLEPAIVLMENVPGIAAVPGFSSFRRFLKNLREAGYECEYGVLNARDFGVPQHRRRYVLLAARDEPVELPSPPMHTKPNLDGNTVRSTIGCFPAIDAGETHPSIPNHHAARLSERNLERITATPVDGGSHRDWPQQLRLECHMRTDGYSDVYGRMWWDRVAPTLTSRCNSLSNGRFGHPEQNRAISLREAAALQTFSDDDEFLGPKTRIARWIGNAVPVSFAEALGQAAMKAAA